MKMYGIDLSEGSKIVNATVDSGESFPSEPDDGELFFKTGASAGFYVYLTGPGWVQHPAITDPRLLLKDSGTGELTANLNLGGFNITNVGTIAGFTPAGATTSAAGFMSAADKTKIDTVATNATANVGTVTSIGVSAPSAGFTISPAALTGAGTFVFTLADDLAALEALSGTGLARRTGANAWSLDSTAYTANTGTVTSVSVTTNAGVSGSVATATTTPAITITLGDVTPTSVAASGTVTGSNLSGTNTGDNAVNTTYASDYRAANFVAGTNYLAPTGSAAALTSFPTLNQNTTGSAGTLTTGRTISLTGDVSGTSAAFDGSGNLSFSTTLATVPVSKGGTGLTGVGTALQVLRTNAGATALEWGTASGGTPAGATGTVQYNNTGAFAGATNVSIANGDLLLAYDPALPTATTGDTLRVFNRSLGGRNMLSMVGSAGLDTALQPLIARNKIAFWNPIGNATAVPTSFGTSAPTALGTATARSVTTTNVLTRMKRLGYVSAATAPALCGHYNVAGTTQYTTGTGTDLGGFHFIARWGVTDVQSSVRMFIGMTSQISVPTNVEPNTLLNSIGVAQISTSANLHIVYGGSSAQTPIDLGSNFPASSNTDAYDVSIFCPPNSTTSFGYTVTRIGTAQFVTGTVTGTAGVAIPAATTLLGPRLWRCNNANLAVVGIDIASWYIEVDQ